MKKLVSLLIFSCCFSFAAVGVAQEIVLPERLPDHPRWFLTKKREREIKEQSARDPFLNELVQATLRQADRLLGEPPTRYDDPVEEWLLDSSRRSFKRTASFVFAYRITNEKKYADAAIAEVLSVCRFPDWNPKHFLDTAELSVSVAIGYDGIYDLFSEAERKEIRNALKKHAFIPGLEYYENKRKWVVRESNWNAVCNGGLTVAALSVAESDREIAQKILDHARASVQKGLSEYAPEGVYPEGPAYWAFGTSFLGLMISAFEDVLGTDYGMSDAPGFSRTGDYYMNVHGSTGRCFNYADAEERIVATPVMFLLAKRFQRPDYAVWQTRMLPKTGMIGGSENWERFAAFQAIWYQKGDDVSAFEKTPLAKKLTGLQDVVSFRTSWSDSEAAYVGFKAGNNRAGHGHLDVGVFVYEVGGIRWASDLGPENYISGYFDGNRRWDFLRAGTRGHNTLVIGDQNQDRNAKCTISDFRSSEKEFSATCDMSDAYRGQADSVIRRVTLKRDGTLVVEDRLEGVRERTRWGMITPASLVINSRTALLSQNGKTLEVVLVSENAEQWESLSLKPPTERETQNENFRMLAAIAEPRNGRVHFKVILKLQNREE